MKWFKHFSNAHDGNGLTKVRMKFGADGYAIYWYCLELISGDLGADESITFELKHDAEVIGFNLKIDSIKVEEIMTYMVNLGLFERSGHTITCLELARNLDKRVTRNKTIHRIIDEVNEDKICPSLSETSGDILQPSALDLDLDLDLDLKIKTKGRFAPPSLQDVKNYCQQRENRVNASDFIDHYEANGWFRGKTKIKDWKACVRTWEKKSESVKPVKFAPSGMTMAKLPPRVGESKEDYENRLRTTRP